MKNSLFKNFISFSYGNWIGLIIGFLTTMVTTRILRTEDFGKASMFVMTINVIMIFIQFGTDHSFIRFFYEEENAKRTGLLYNCLKIPTMMLVLISVILLLFKNRISIFLFDEVNYLAVFMLFLGILGMMGDRYGRLVVRMQQKGGLYSLLEVLLKVITFVSLLIFYSVLGAGYDVIIYSTVSGYLILVFITIYKERYFWNPKNILSASYKHSQQKIIKFGFPLMITSLVTWLFQSFDKIAIRNWSTLDELGIYAAAAKIVALAHVFQITFSNFWTPVCYEHYEENPEDKAFFRRMMGMISLGMFTVGIGSIAAKDIIVYLLGADYREASNIMSFLIFMPVLHTISETTVIGINFKKKPKWHVFIGVVVCVINIIGNSILVPEYGAVGASISTAASYVVFFILRTEIARKYYNVNFGLKRFYFALSLVTSYAIISIMGVNFWMNLLIGFGMFLILLLIYHKEVREIGTMLIKK